MLARPRAVAALIVLILVELVVAQSLNLFPRVTSIDFYQYWGVSAARRLSDQALDTPYTNAAGYRAVLDEYAARFGPSKAEGLRAPAFTATPFAYMLFAVFPADYPRAALLFHALQVLLFVAAVIVLGGLYRYPLFPLLCLAFLLVLGSGPLFSDVRLGNLGCFQLFALAGVLALADRLRRVPGAAALGAVVLSSLTLLTLVKPNVALVAAIMAVHLWLAHGNRLFAIAAVPALVSGAAAVVIPCLYFRSWTVWQEWYRVVVGADPYRLAVDPGGGNYSSTRQLSLWLQADVWTVAAFIAAALIISMIAVSVKAERRLRASSPWAGLASAFRDPHLAAAIGVTMTIALSPLFWYHYYVLALIPGLWLLNASSPPGYLPLCGLAALVLSSGLLNVLLLPLGWTGAAAAGAALSWVPLWGGILLRTGSPGPQESEATSGQPPAEPPRERGTPRVRPAHDARASRAVRRH